MRRIILMALLATVPLLTGMGAMQGPSSPDKIPVPAKQYHATFVDQMDVATECTEMTIEGAVYLEGKKGEGNYTVSFENIEKVSFRLAAERLIGAVQLDGGGTIELVLNKRHRAYGRTQYGTFQIRLVDLKTMTLSPSPKK